MKYFTFTFIYFVLISASFGQNFIQCPPNITISCCQDYNDINITGDPANINVSFSYFTHSDSLGIDECRIGTIKRTWTGYNNVGHFDCVQYITLRRDNAFDGKINWPKDWAGSCSDPIPYEEPYYDIGFCDQVAHTFHDDTFRFDPNACIKILRNWKVIDWCIFEPNSGSNKGLYEHTQVFMIVDKTAPEVLECSNKTYMAMNSDCTGDVTFEKSAEDVNCGSNSELKWVFELDINNDWITDTVMTVFGDNPKIEFKSLPVGTHKARWKVFDPCANVSTCMENITVKDGKPPTLATNLSVASVLMQGGDTLTLNAKCFVIFAEDNCTPREDIIFSFSPDKKDTLKGFNCNNLGFQFLRIYAIDEEGNSDFTYILIRIEAHEPCENHIVSGTIKDMKGNPLSSIDYSIAGHGKNIKIGTSDSSGIFSLPISQNSTDIKIKFDVGEFVNPAIDEDDANAMKNYLLGKIELTETQKNLADLNNDGFISIADLRLLKELMHGQKKYSDIENAAVFYINDIENQNNLIRIDSISK